MLKIRLQRVGRTHEPAYRLVLTESLNSTKSGRFKEILGSYDPRKTSEFFKVDRIKHWLSHGVITTPSIHNLLVEKGIVTGEKIHVSKHEYVAPPPAEVVADSAPEPVAETVAPETTESPAEVQAPEAEAPAPVEDIQ